MLTNNDFSKKQLIFVFANEGERICITNENLVVKDSDGKVKLQCSCYRLFLVFVVGHMSITTSALMTAKKFGFYFALLTAGFHLYSVVGADKDGNTLLKRKQYEYSGNELAKVIVRNKIANQRAVLKRVRDKNISTKEAISFLEEYENNAAEADSLQELMAYEGLSSKIYFRNHFSNVVWNGRKPRLKYDFVNSTLDIGYTLLFSFIDAILSCYGFDTYCGVLHRQFYMRKSLVCDIVEPFRPLIDMEIKKGIGLKQIKEDDFCKEREQYLLKWKNNSRYIKLLMTPIMENKENIFFYIREFYRAFMKDMPPDKFPTYNIEV